MSQEACSAAMHCAVVRLGFSLALICAPAAVTGHVSSASILFPFGPLFEFEASRRCCCCARNAGIDDHGEIMVILLSGAENLADLKELEKIVLAREKNIETCSLLQCRVIVVLEYWT